MFLINALYFKGSWTQRFDASRTRLEPFHGEDGSVVQVPTMQGMVEIGHRVTDDYRVIDLPYGRGAFSMTILLPHEPGGIDELVASLDVGQWEAAVMNLTEQEVEVHLPRFRIAYEQKLNDALKGLGMELAFVFRAADFSGMSATHGRLLYIDEVLQKSFVDVNEQGTEAAAATSVGVKIGSAPAPIRVDRPFGFAIRERFSGTILFIGKVTDPS
ncbi:MAG TPA: serpin family protein [Longimicrobiaceae bacterium]